jgi:hypothetical protein
MSHEPDKSNPYISSLPSAILQTYREKRSQTVTTQCGVTGQSLINSWFRYSNCYNSDYWPNLLPCWLNGITDRYTNSISEDLSSRVNSLR